ncbi:MAG: UDP-N-acetylenolpyruvoylglucosamine reductase [uncultured bacterium]|uniref:UDP-N-acetylenolpyruvoylglucosamine reductase n=1 Tax=Candidatus Woesebacteria bacterium RIFCSPHIGHO2_12_FULL_41_24 TaxID=1802510 RepID=A0A1F8AQT8_9BACT|nr:MAG: UDP-N-acetylenolpyruvoylglucosamine reductase [uncultured bacterium]OGM13261.1 MAG: UDP-N-acetylenolpyruvoylglucosamine reductase [Candidatus Woesebacteria bacterium RBG_16_41_13]OGM30663.1 MAG: UDP-N-acetylenolpyruvoylglucosamine reductase [Candidatus Woesebacteria bacterium RIFCSPHIGHO2_01_FULL_42_80]OGM35800.1 MAG: UDP-N-acetylenolpyruvoylglucosamine reductase [Candidatus Woesebacteria bacterium RIFCSPHIGHO2_02_FULL_42_20]OGM53859.1 MAG: UDP-N-acetylenolpyruvoylglucosamine reductase 
MKIITDYNLKRLNSFKVNIKTKYFVEIKKREDLREISKSSLLKVEKFHILGDGTNTLFTQNFDGLVIKISIPKKQILSDDTKEVLVKVNAGENWHKFVMWSVNNRLSGIEDLSLIPGTIGAAPVQNLAAYGQNFGAVTKEVEGISLDTNKLETITKNECKFYYRDSIFKHELKNKFFITSVSVKLSKTPHFSTDYFGSAPYESLKQELIKIVPDLNNLTPKIVAQAVTNLRRIKMPDWTKVGTAGSFFKNPVVTKNKYRQLLKVVPNLQAYPVNEMLYPDPDDPIFKMANYVKIPAGRLLDELGWKGKRIGNVGTFEKHALVIINHGNATGQEILEFSQKMQEDIYTNYDLKLEPEVNII